MILTRDLSKHFRTYKKAPGLKGAFTSFFSREPILRTAVNQFDLDIKEGEFIGLLGPNGAGKTTLMKMLTGIIVPSQGEVLVAGHNPSERKVEFRKQIALVMGQKAQLWWDIPAMDSFLLLQKYYEISDDKFQRKVDQLSSLLSVRDLLQVHVRKLSLGERMKMELMASLLHDPQVIFLDEPTIGLDLVAQKNIRDFLIEYHQAHRPTIVLTSHYMADVEALCSRIVLILDGKKRFDGPIEQFEDILGKEKFVTFYFQESISHEVAWLKEFEPRWDQEHRQVELRISEERLREVCTQILQSLPVSDFNTEKMPIERVLKTLMSQPEILDTRP